MKKKTKLSFYTMSLAFIPMLNSTSLSIIAEDVPTTRAIRDLSFQKKTSFDDSHPIKFELVPYLDLLEKADHDLYEGTGLYDVILQYNTALANYISHNYLVSIVQMRKQFPHLLVNGTFPFEEDLFQNCWKEIGWYKTSSKTEEEAYVIPFTANSMIMAYNRELFTNESYQREYREKYKKTLAPPQNWEEFKCMVEFFHRPNEKIYGICLQGAPYFIYHEWANFAFSFGGGLMKKKYGWEESKDIPLLITTPETIHATQFYVDLKKFDASDDFLKTDAATQVQVLKKKKCALALVWSDVAYSLAYENGQPLGIYDFAPIPGNVSMLAGGSFYINRHSHNIDAAMEFVLSQMNQERQIALMKTGLCSPLKSIYNSDEVQKIPYAHALKTSLERGVYMLEAGAESDAIIIIMSNLLQNLMRDSAKEERIARDLNLIEQEIRTILKNSLKELK